jgi:hypothetical protein
VYVCVCVCVCVCLCVCVYVCVCVCVCTAAVSPSTLSRVDQNHKYTMHTRYFGRKITKYTVVYGRLIRLRPTLTLSRLCSVTSHPLLTSLPRTLSTRHGRRTASAVPNTELPLLQGKQASAWTGRAAAADRHHLRVWPGISQCR